MKHLTLILAIATLSLSAQAQDDNIGNIRAGAGLIYATDINNLGIALKGVYTFTPEWEGAFGFTHILKKNYVSYNVVDLDAQYIFAHSDDQMSFFAIGGIALNFWNVSYPDSWWGVGGSASGSDIGLNLGAGGIYQLSNNLLLVPEIRITLIDGSYARLGATIQYTLN